ncbi:hypothetical protein K8Z61_14985 [Nocardioides sp. TRM66260-LWL]|uniref:hypothetical protein n=1 Tax=Nocardioides sp. TRM66260-LWL TaxID=2874478 RepID=UPI001CC50579|nr:hypothetical protein [Nocardioides sp. TRM66260-LWL]MBZ5735797.1 hypothetical protein [Nocardioides sp. TRM66260-LWL]
MDLPSPAALVASLVPDLPPDLGPGLQSLQGLDAAVPALRARAEAVRALGEELVTLAARTAWEGAAADALRERLRRHRDELDDLGRRHELAATLLERHLEVVRAQLRGLELAGAGLSGAVAVGSTLLDRVLP